jgi:HAD superfamily phosphatase (TIGR01681 family)
LNWQPAASDVDSKNVVDLVAATTIAPGMARHSQVRMGRLRDEDGFYIDESDTSGMPHAVLKMKVLNELGVDPDAWYEFQEGNQPREKTPEWVAKQDYEGRGKYYADLNKDWEARRKHWLAENPTNQEFDRSMGIEMAAALRKELLLRGEHTLKKHLIVFDFDGTLTEDYAGVTRKRLFGSEQRIADLRDFLEALHEDAHLIVCSRSGQNVITDRLRGANLLHPFDLVVDRNHMRHLDNANKGRVLNELLLPLFPSIGGPGDVLFVDDDPSNIKDLKKLAPHCTTFECERNTGLTRADIRLLLGEQKEGKLLVDGVSTHRRGEQNGTPTSFLTTDGGEREPVAKGS